MPRKAREKHNQAIFHIMCRSISELNLFRDDDDKNYYLYLLKKYTDKFKCSIYGYCLMDNHLHLHFDPKGFDISKFMHCLNTAYVRFYNRKYQRHGHVFQDRFESRILDSDEYNLTVSAYIHNNPHNLEDYKGKEERYKYSSYGIYLGLIKDLYQLVDTSFIKKLFSIKDSKKFIDRYFSFVSHQRDIGSLKKLKEKLDDAVEYEYKSGREIIIRDMSPAKVISFISSSLLSSKGIENIKKRKTEFRAFAAYTLRLLCGLGYKEICKNLYNITISGCSYLCGRGYKLITQENSIYSRLISELIGKAQLLI